MGSEELRQIGISLLPLVATLLLGIALVIYL